MKISGLLKNKLFLPISCFCVFTAAALLLIIRHPIAPVFDQSFILYRFSSGYPTFEQGIVSNLIAAVLNWSGFSDPIRQNTLMRAAAAVLYLLGASLFAFQLFRERKPGFLFPVFLLLLILSGFPFLWLSSELLAGAFLLLTLWSAMRGNRFIFTAFFLSAYCLTKPDLIFSGLMLGALLILSKRRENGWVKPAGLLCGLLVFGLVPGLVGTASSSSRSFESFEQHFAALDAPSPLGSSPDPWLDPDYYVQKALPGVKNMADVLTRYPAAYTAFLGWSLEKSVQNMFESGLLLLAAGSWLFLEKGKCKEFTYALAVLFSSLVPVTLFSYFHVRYQAKFYPLFLAFYLLAVAQVKGKKRLLLFTLGAILVGVQIVMNFSAISGGYWFPD